MQLLVKVWPGMGSTTSRYDHTNLMWYELLVELNGRSYDWRGKLYLTEGGRLRPIPKWFTLFSLVVGRRQRLTEVELSTDLAGEPLT